VSPSQETVVVIKESRSPDPTLQEDIYYNPYIFLGQIPLILP